MLAQFQKDHPDEVRLVFRQFPLPTHPLSLTAAAAAEAGGKQGKFFEMMEDIFAHQSDWSQMTESDFTTWVKGQAEALELDVAQFETDMQSQAIKDKVLADQKYAIDIAIPGTPFLLLNGLRYDGARDPQSLESVLSLFKLSERQYTECPPFVIDPQKEYIATIKTEKGDIQIQLLQDKAPLAVNSFVFLARAGWFDNITFHRVLQGFMAQTGDPTGSGIGGPGYAFANESSDLKFDAAGVVGMANAGADTNGSQFFITLDPANHLNGTYTIFGKVINGMDVVKSLTLRDPQNDPGAPPGDKLLTITIEEK